MGKRIITIAPLADKLNLHLNFNLTSDCWNEEPITIAKFAKVNLALKLLK